MARDEAHAGPGLFLPGKGLATISANLDTCYKTALTNIADVWKSPETLQQFP